MHPTQMRAFRDELEGMEKQAIIGTALLGLGMHSGLNLGVKAFAHSKAGQRFQAGQLATGFNHGLEGKNINPIARNVATFLPGPESLENYEVGRALGGQMSDLSKGRRYRELKKLRKNMAMTTELRKAPVARSVVPAVNRILDGAPGMMDKLPTVAAGAAPTLGQRAVSAGLGAAAVAAEPHAALHFGINGARDLISRSALGRRFMKNQFTAGLQKAMPEGLRTAGEIAISPAAFHTRQIGEALARESHGNPQVVRRLAGSLGGQALGLPSMQQAVATHMPQVQQLIAQHAPGLAPAAQGMGALGLRRAASSLSRTFMR